MKIDFKKNPTDFEGYSEKISLHIQFPYDDFDNSNDVNLTSEEFDSDDDLPTLIASPIQAPNHESISAIMNK